MCIVSVGLLLPLFMRLVCSSSVSSSVLFSLMVPLSMLCRLWISEAMIPWIPPNILLIPLVKTFLFDRTDRTDQKVKRSILEACFT